MKGDQIEVKTDRGNLPKGVTKVSVAKRFKRGYCVACEALRHGCERRVIEDAIREVMNRQPA